MKIQKYIISVVLILVLFLTKSWWMDTLAVKLGYFLKKETKVETVIEYSKGDYEIDSLAIYTHYAKIKGVLKNKEPKVIYKSKLNPTIKESLKIDTTSFTNNFKVNTKVVTDSLKQFKVEVKDNNINGVFTINNTFTGDLESSSFEYEFKEKEKFLKRIDTLKVTNNITETLSNKKVKLSLGTGYNFSNNNVQFLGGLIFKNDIQILYEYQMPIKNNLTPNVIFNQESHSIKALINF